MSRYFASRYFKRLTTFPVQVIRRNDSITVEVVSKPWYSLNALNCGVCVRFKVLLTSCAVCRRRLLTLCLFIRFGCVV